MARTPERKDTGQDWIDRRRGTLRVALAFPGGFEFGGIGRMMLYATAAWGRSAEAPRAMVVDARGNGSRLLMPYHLARAVARVVAARRAGSLDLLHLNVAGRGSTLRKIVLSELAGLLRLPTVVHLHDYDYASHLDRSGRLTRMLVRRMFGRAETVIVLGERDRQTAAGRLGVPPGRIATMPNAVPDPGAPPDREARVGPCRIVFLGHLDDRKGVPELLAALASLALTDRPWRLDLAGAGEVDRFRAEVARRHLQDRATLHGWLSVPQVTALCRRADIFVLPSHAEGQAMSLLEAMAHGLAIITTPVGAHLEAVTGGVEALLVPPGDADALAAALARLLDDQGLRLRLGRAARARYAAGFAIEPYATRLAALHEAAAWRTRMERPKKLTAPLRGAS